MTAEKRAVSRRTVLTGVLILAVAAVSGWFFWRRLSGLPSYARGESSRVSPVLKPSGLEQRSFFLAGDRYLMRLDRESPSLLWKIDRPATGDLEVAFHAAPKGEPAPSVNFSVSVAESGGAARELISRTWVTSPGKAVGEAFKVPVSIAPGSSIEFRLTPPEAGDPSLMDAGITIPRIHTQGSGPQPSNLLIISIDALRQDYLGVYQALSGHPPEQSFSPELDRFSENAVVFLNARTTQSSTWPALSSLHLSAYPSGHGVTENRVFLESPGESMATLMRDRGFATVSMGSAMSLNIPGFEIKRRYFRADDRLLNAGRALIAAQAVAPFFHWYHLLGCHDQYNPPEWVMKIVARDDPGYVYKKMNTNDLMLGQAPCGPKEVADVRKLYAGTLFYTDSLLKEFFDELKRLGVWDNTLVIVTADHGEELYDHHGFFHHSPSLYEGALRVPLLIKFPRQRGRRVVAENVSHIDILPTIYHYFAGRPEPGRFAGLSLLDLLAGKSRAFRERVTFAEVERSRVAAAILGKYKLIYNPAGITPKTPNDLPFPMGPVEFYDLEKDPGETINLAQAENPVLRRLLAEASRYIRDAQAPRRERAKAGNIELSEEERREADEVLRSLGYIK
jgi:arylsulfatase A-like enzyme